ncbi:XRE family transcriptional regulator [Kribbella pittospori]|uniref:XRE family transcriptional regulator n=1 Tax=Kribbella pittospori TaxID=722689 RepID=A0A4R0KAD4_9ACTN|nr:helix-turn-helix transcriptional regulator [Kribbella pittospori]TCC56520.1 XRE family transcriptional regulator [Kribbella pittospori]
MTEIPVGPDDPRELRRTIADQIRVARKKRKMSQEALGVRVGVTRYVINRIERENQDLSLDLAVNLAETLDLPELEMLTQAQLTSSPVEVHPNTRNARLQALLRAPLLDRLEIVVADELDILGLLHDARPHLPSRVNIVFPTRARQAQLRGSAGTRVPAWAVQNQITRIFEALAIGGRLRPTDAALGFDIKLYESDDIRQSFVLVGAADGIQCAVWPSLPNIEPNFGALPVAVSRDQSFIRLIQDHFSKLTSDDQTLTHLKAVVVVDRATESTPATPIAEHRLSSYFQLGTDSERSEAAAGDETTGRFGFGVALVLIHGVAERAGRPLERRILLPKDPKSKKFQLFSTHISDEDVTGTGERGPRSTSNSQSARRKFIADHPDAIIKPDIFIRAARHGLLDEYGADVPASAIQEIPLPESLWIVEKTDKHGRMMPVVPRLFHLDLTPRAYQDETSGASIEGAEEMEKSMKPDGWDASVGLLEAALQDDAAGRAFSRRDLQSSVRGLNDFLVTAVTEEKKWFFSELERLEIEE